MAKDPEDTEKRQILIGVDESEGSARAVEYVAEILGCLHNVHVTLLNVIAVPDDDFFPSKTTRMNWINGKQSEAQQMLEAFSTTLMDAGIAREDIDTNIITTETASSAEVVIEVQEELRAGTVVLARRGVPREEEFLLGSTANKLLHSLRNCTVWVVE